jgi:transposase-like protein
MSKGKLDGAEKPAGAGETTAIARAEMDALSGVQRIAMEALLTGKSVAETARESGVTRGTIYQWLKRDAAFQAAYNQWHEMMKESCRSRLMMMDKAASAVEKALEAGDVKPALALLKGMGMISREEERSTEAHDVAKENSTKQKRKRAKLVTEEMMAEFGA